MKILMFENESYKVSQDISQAYIKNKVTNKTIKRELDDKLLISTYLEIILNGKHNEFFDEGFEEFMREKVNKE